MIEIIGPALSQWDVKRSVKVTNIEADFVHFANKGDSRAVIMDIVDAQAKIPDYLLQTGKPVCVYAVKDGITVESKTFHVQNRERPENYVYEDDQRNYIYELITNAERATEEANEAAERANEAADKMQGPFVKTVNGSPPDENGNVEVAGGSGGGISAETDPTVPAWAKQPNKPTYTAKEVGALPADTVIPDAVTDEHINSLIDEKLGVIENGTY